ncbi:MAG: putative selenate reductase subunit YgfK [Eubacteriales bacterium]|nr:putative selenate reductase subunit YgfK [Eubacteriales bacterium]
MRDIMTPIPFDSLMKWILDENKKHNKVFGLHTLYHANSKKTYSIFGKKIETLIGPAAGPHTQLAQNIIASYLEGARFIELKTVQKLDGLDLPVSKPCIKADDEGYNCEWSTELFIPQAFDEYVKAYFAIKILSKEWGLGDMDAFLFSMSVGYDLDGIKTKKINDFIEGLKDATNTPQFIECKEWLEKNIKLFKKFKKADISKISGKICNQVTLSTLHGCPPKEIERIATYLITEKKLHTLIKCNPTLLGYDYARKMLDDLGYDYIKFGEFHFNDDLQYKDALPMLSRLKKIAEEKKLKFGVKITNTFPVDVKEDELPSEEMYMSGRALFPLSLSVAMKLANDFDGELMISYSGGCDANNVNKLLEAGIFPITVATTLLKPGGYGRFIQLAESSTNVKVKGNDKVNAQLISSMVNSLKKDTNLIKKERPDKNRTIGREKKVPLIDCFIAPCMETCPIHQDITTYGALVGEGKYEEALKVILEKNPLPFITGTICNHKCMQSCTRNYYEESIQIRHNKLLAAIIGYDKVIKEIKIPKANGKKVVVVGAGPAGISVATFLAKRGYRVKVFDKDSKIGGIVRNVIPSFRIKEEYIEKDVSFAKALGVEFVLGRKVLDIKQLIKEEKANYGVLAIGANKNTKLPLESGNAIKAHSFLRDYNLSGGNIQIGENVIVVGGGNTAMDAARAAKRTKGVKNVYLLYRRSKMFMPADEEELREAMDDGVIFKELLLPVSLKSGIAICKKMILGEKDESGRRKVTESDTIEEIKCDTIIAAIGETVDSDVYSNMGILVDEKGKAIVDQNNQTSIKNVYVAGDCNKGASVVVNAIKDAMIVAEGISGKKLFKNLPSQMKEEEHYSRKIKITNCEICLLNKNEKDKILEPDKKRCLCCDTICENCVEVCPNRANVSIEVDPKYQKLFNSKYQIIHIDYMCNECGNCKTFCPYNSAPYKEKFTLFLNKQDLYASENQGFCPISKDSFLVKLDNTFYTYKIGDTKVKFDKRIGIIIDTIIKKYSYLIWK